MNTIQIIKLFTVNSTDSIKPLQTHNETGSEELTDLETYLGEEIVPKEDSDYSRLIDISSDVVKSVLNVLLQDKTTKKNIIWATDAYSSHRKNCSDTSCITQDVFFEKNKILLQPRIEKAQDQQQERTRKKAEVFTPVWICNRMNNYLDEEWFGRKDVFNHENEGNTWTVVEEKISFPEGRTWMEYVDSRRLEITCGEAPYLVSRYDASTGQFILPPLRRIGILDRKLRIVNENTCSKEEWDKWVERAYQSCYGYEWQGDSLLIARINLLMTFHDYYVERWNCEPEFDQVKRIANIISWNLWQMDGLNDVVPYGKPFQEQHQTTLFDSFGSLTVPQGDEARPCKIYDWRRDNSVLFKKCKSRGKMGKKLFDFIIGNPPYQEINDKNTRQPPVYHLFMDASYKIGDVVELITPARFLFNAGQTPKEWNIKMLDDEHLKILFYEKDASIIFPNTDIKGGVVISYYNNNELYDPIKIFTPYIELNNIVHKVSTQEHYYLDEIISSRGCYRYSDTFYNEYPEIKNNTNSGTGNMIASNAFENVPNVFIDEQLSSDYIKLTGRLKNKRVSKYILKKYVIENEFLNSYNVLLTEANNNGEFGETLTSTYIAEPGEGATDTFISIGHFSNRIEAENVEKYLKCKFLRAMLGVKKATQHNPKSTWIHVPLLDFTNNSDINWSKSIREIDQQLYQKYGLSNEEIEFIESHVQEMN